MMTRWLISAPVWGARYVEEFCATTMPALELAVLELVREYNVDVRVIIHTDSAERISGATGLPVEYRPVPVGARDFDCMSQAHRDVIAAALTGDIVVFLTAGAVISEQGLVYCAEILTNSHIRCVLCAVPRVLPEGQLPDTANARELMAWGWKHRHPLVDDCTWPDGKSGDLSRTFFVSKDTVVTRQALPHPLAVRINGRPLRFTPTVDANLIHCFDTSEMHMTPDCAKLSMIKLTPVDKDDRITPYTMQERLERYELVIADKFQQWCLGQPVTLIGPPRDCGDVEFVDKIMKVSGGKR